MSTQFSEICNAGDDVVFGSMIAGSFVTILVTAVLGLGTYAIRKAFRVRKLEKKIGLQ